MESILQGFIPSADEFNLLEIIFKMLFSSALGAIIAFHMSTFHRTMHNMERLKLAKAEIIICMVGAVMVIVIGDNVARAFGLFGLGSFIRFRTAIKDAIDTAIIFVLIGIGMAIGVGLFLHALVVAVILYLILYAISFIKTQQDKIEDMEIRAKLQALKTVAGSEGSNETEMENEEIKDAAVNENQGIEEVKTSKKKECPQCAEKVKIKAAVCRYCGYEFDEEDDD